MLAGQVLTHEQIEARLRRMAYQIAEANFSEARLVLLGIEQRGQWLASELARHLAQVRPSLHTALHPLQRAQPQAPALAAGSNVLIVDDVLYTGRTLYEALVAVMQTQPSQVQVAVLVDRGHRRFPVTADFVGVELATGIRDYVRILDDPEGTPGRFTCVLTTDSIKEV
jgi:pyrimidine operon attenuation protein/uracil phosphoribosyltransferase